MALKTPRIAGTIRTLNRVGIGTANEITFGVIESATGQFYVWASTDLSLDGTRAKANAPCTFETIGLSHATNISTVDLEVS